jgi:glutamine amidotransferase
VIGVVEYGMGNVQSVRNAVEHLGFQTCVVRAPGDVAAARRLILPGVGAFAAGMENLARSGLAAALERAVAAEGKPFLGICLGMQLLCREGYEHGRHAGLGWIDASVRPFDKAAGLRIPHVGWNSVRAARPNALIAAEERDVYFVHSFYVDEPDADFVSATCEYGVRFTAAVEKGRVFGTQFHLEKSQKAGLDVLRRFCEL